MLRVRFLARAFPKSPSGWPCPARGRELVTRPAKLLVAASLLLGCAGAPTAPRPPEKPLGEMRSEAATVAVQPLITDFTGPTAPLFHGRFDRSAKDGPYFAWSGSSITVRFEGTELSADLREGGDNRFAVIVDGVLRPEPIVPGAGVHTIQLAAGLAPGEHTVTLYRLTEPLVGETQLLGLRLSPGGKMLTPPPAAERRIEVIGDSISTGYGNEGNNPECGFSPKTQNHYETYGAITARAVERRARHHCLVGARRVFEPRQHDRNGAHAGALAAHAAQPRELALGLRAICAAGRGDQPGHERLRAGGERTARPSPRRTRISSRRFGAATPTRRFSARWARS